jgi:hypothetical protein
MLLREKCKKKTELMGRRRRRSKQLLEDYKERRDSYELKERALDRTVWRTRYERRYVPVVRQTAK